MKKTIKGNINGANVRFTANNIYDAQAIDFMIKAQFTIAFSFMGSKEHFGSDDQKRDVWMVVFSRGRDKSFNVEFGQSIANKGEKPCAYDVLACIQSYEPEGDFQDFCREFGYTEISEYDNAHKVFDGVHEEWRKVVSFFTDEQIEQLQEIQ